DGPQYLRPGERIPPCGGCKDRTELKERAESGHAKRRPRRRENGSEVFFFYSFEAGEEDVTRSTSCISSGRGAVNSIGSPVMGWGKDSRWEWRACRPMCVISGLYR